jgi:hypothetical protein
MNPNLLSIVQSAFHKAEQGDQVKCRDLLLSATVEYGADAVVSAMPQVDPKRLYMDYPLQPGELGLHGYPMIENSYKICSDVYGHHLNNADGLISNKTLERFEQAWEDGDLYDYGHMALNKADNSIGFLVVLPMENTTIPRSRELDSFNKNGDLKAECLAWPNEPALSGGYYNRERLCITVFLPGTDRLHEAARISRQLLDIERIWERLPKQKENRSENEITP